MGMLSLLSVRNGERFYNLFGRPASSSVAPFSDGRTVKVESRKRAGDQLPKKAAEEDLVNVCGCISATVVP